MGTEAAETETISQPLVDEPMPEIAEAPPEKSEGVEEAHAEEATPETTGDTQQKDREGWIPRDRFDEVNERAKKVPDLERQLAELSDRVKSLAEPTETKPAEPGFLEKLTQMEADDLRDQFDENPAAFLQQYGEALAEKIQGQLRSTSEKETFESRVVSTISEFAKKNPEFDQLWDSGKIQQFMNDHPGFDAVGSFYELTSEAREKALEKKIREKVHHEIKTGRAASSLPSGPSAAPGNSGDISPEVMNPSKFGLTSTQALAKSLEAYRKSKAG